MNKAAVITGILAVVIIVVIVVIYNKKVKALTPVKPNGEDAVVEEDETPIDETPQDDFVEEGVDTML